MARKQKKAVENPEPRVSLSLRTILYFLFLFSLLTCCLLAHIYLRFTIRDLRVESVRLQAQAEKMREMEKELQWELEKLKNSDRLREYAGRELGLVELEPGLVERLEVPASLMARYNQTPGRNQGYEEASWAEARNGGGIRRDWDSLLTINRELTAREESLDMVWDKIRKDKEARKRIGSKEAEKKKTLRH